MANIPFSHGVMDETGNIVIPFSNMSIDFLRGFQCGQFHEALDAGFEYIRIPIHVENAEMVMRLCEAYEYIFYAEEIPAPDDTDQEWLYVTATAPNKPVSIFKMPVNV